MFSKKTQIDIKKLTGKVQDSKKDTTSRLRHLKTILEHIDIEEAKSLFETNYSHVYFILYDTFVQAETNLRQRELSFHLVHKAHREELDGSLWLLGKILCLLPELIARRWQCHSLGRIMAKLLHHGNSSKLRREGVRFFLLWYQALSEQSPPHVHSMYAELVPGLTIPQKGTPIIGLSGGDQEYPDLMNHPNMKGEMGASVFHDTGVHPVRAPDITPLLPPATNERTAAPDPRDGLEILLDCMVQATGCLKWRDNTPQKHKGCFAFLLQRFREIYLPYICPGFDQFTSIYEPKLDLPVMRTITKRDETMSSCVIELILWIANYTRDKCVHSRVEHVNIEDDVGENASLLSNLRYMGYSQPHLVQDVLYSTRDTVNFVHEVFRQAFLLNFSTKSQISAVRTVITVYKEWMSTNPPIFFLEPEENLPESAAQRSQRLRTDSYLGAMTKEHLLVRAGLQNCLQIFVTHAANVFMVQTGHLTIKFPSKVRETTPLDEQTDICKSVLNIYRTMVMNTRMDSRTWEQLLLVLLQITAVILSQAPPNSKRTNLGGRLAQPVFQTLIVTWIRAHTNVHVNVTLWEKFLNVLSSLTHREELIIEWDKTMQTLTRVMARQVYNINLQDLPLDRLAEQKGKRRRTAGGSQSQSSQTKTDGRIGDDRLLKSSQPTSEDNSLEETGRPVKGKLAIGQTSSLNRSYSEGNLTPIRKSRPKRRVTSQKPPPPITLPATVEYSLSHGLTVHRQPSTIRRALSLDSIRRLDDREESLRGGGSRSPSPTVSTGLDGGSVKDSPIQMDVMAVDSSSTDTPDDSLTVDRRSVLMGGTARGWLPDVAAIMWRRMLGAMGNVNRILNPKLHALVFKRLVDITDNLIKIKQNQGVVVDGSHPIGPITLIPPIGIVAPWCYEALSLDRQYRDGKLWALQLICTITKSTAAQSILNEQLPFFYLAVHRALTGEDRTMSHTVLKFLGGPRFLSLLLPGHSLLLLDLVHAASVILTSMETKMVPRAEVASLLGSLLCLPSASLPKPVLQPSEPHIDLIECPDLQEHILNVVLRCARREPTSRARCIAISSLGQWIVQMVKRPIISKDLRGNKKLNDQDSPHRSRIPEAIQVILQALQFKHRIIARIAAETIRLCAERGQELSRIPGQTEVIIKAICTALEIQNVRQPKEADKIVLTNLLLCLGEFAMSVPTKHLTDLKNPQTGETPIGMILNILHQIATGAETNYIKLFTPDDDFNMSIVVDDVAGHRSTEAVYQTTETTQACKTACQLCAQAVASHLIANLMHFPLGVGASRLSSLVDESDDLIDRNQPSDNSSAGNPRDSMDLNASNVLNAPNIQMMLLNPGLIASFIELPALKLPGGGITAGLVTPDRQVRVLLRDLNGKYCWDASLLYREPKVSKPIPRPEPERTGKQFLYGQPGYNKGSFSGGGSLGQSMSCGSASLDPLTSTIGLPFHPPMHTLRHRPPDQLPLAKDIAPDLDQLDDLLQYIGHTSPECLNVDQIQLNAPAKSPLGAALEAQTISTILAQRASEQEFLARQKQQQRQQNVYGTSDIRRRKIGSAMSVPETATANRNLSQSQFHYGRLLMSHLGLAGWERRQRTHLLSRTDKLMRELRNLDTQRCRETHKMAVMYVASGQEDKNSILRNSCGSSTYEMFVSALGWEVELESHNGFLGGLPRSGCGVTSPYYATPFWEVIFHVATRMPSDTPEAILTKTRHLGNDEVWIVWSEHYRDYRRDIVPTEFCDVLITVYPLKSGLFRVTINRKADVPWFGPLCDESVVGGACLPMLIRATAINASRAKRTSLPFYQQFYEERKRSLDTVAARHKDLNTFEEFATRIFDPSMSTVPNRRSVSTDGNAPLAAALIDHKSSSKSWHPNVDVVGPKRESTQYTISLSGNNSQQLEHSPPRPHRKLHPFKSVSKRSSTPPDSPTLPGRKFR